MRKVLPIALALSMFAISAQPVFAADAPIKVKFGYMPPELTADTCLETNVAFTFKDYLEENFPGKFEVETYPSGQLGTYAEMYAGTSDGSIEVALINVATIATVDNSLNVWQIPGSIGSLDEIRTLLTDDEALATLDNVSQQTGTTVLMGYSAGARHFTNNVREVKTPDDMNAIVFRTMENQLYVKMVESMGGVAVPMSSSEMYNALQNHVIEGQENPIASIINDLTYQVQDYLTLDGHVYSVAFMVANNAWLDGLDPELQEGVKAAAQAAFESANAFVDRTESEGRDFLEEQGMQIYEPTEEELEQWHEACYNGTIDFVVDQIGQDAVDSFMAIIDRIKG